MESAERWFNENSFDQSGLPGISPERRIIIGDVIHKEPLSLDDIRKKSLSRDVELLTDNIKLLAGLDDINKEDLYNNIKALLKTVKGFFGDNNGKDRAENGDNDRTE